MAVASIYSSQHWSTVSFSGHFGASGDCPNGGRYCWWSQRSCPQSCHPCGEVDSSFGYGGAADVVSGADLLRQFAYNLTVNFDFGLESDGCFGSEVGLVRLVGSGWRCLSRCE